MYYYILDKDGNYIREYKTSIEAAKDFETSANVFTICAKNISALLKGEKPRTSTISTNNLVCVNKQDYIDNEAAIRWLLTKNDILVINKKGTIVGCYKKIIHAFDAIKQDKTATTTVSIAIRTLNKIDRDTYGYRLATRQYYIDMIRKDPLCYMREYDNTGGVPKKPVDMYNTETNKLIRSFNSLSEAAEYFGCTKENIRQCIKTGRPVLKSQYYVKGRE